VFIDRWVVWLMRFTLQRSGGLSWFARATVAAVLVGGSTVAAAGIAAGAQAQIRPPVASGPATVVHEASRPTFGKILVTVNGGMSLYVHPNGSCNAACRGVWPPLLMPAGKTIPKGAPCLKTAKLGTSLQVTYQGHRLYTFTGDSGHSVNGNGVAGFLVAKAVTTCG
jgi:predicted lipoprotein with Yx(FWY)xxD motif